MAWVIQSQSEYRASQRRLQSMSLRLEKRRAYLLDAGAESSEVEAALTDMKRAHDQLAEELKKYERRIARRKKP